jgi:ribokinase
VRSVLVVGGANFDQTAVAPRLPGAGETVLAIDYRETPGGKAANIASAAAAWGVPVCFVGRVGNDVLGDALLAAWADAGVDATHVRRDPAGTGLGIVFMDPGGQYQTVVVPRANANLAAVDVDDLPATVWDDVGAVALALEAPIGATLAAATAAAHRGLPLVLNAAPVEGMDAALWPLVTHLVVNEHEAAWLAGRLVEHPEAAAEAATVLLGRLDPARAVAVVVTLGASGAVVASPGLRAWHAAAPRVEAVDTLGAGDTFVGVLAAEVAAGGDLAAAIALACAAGAAAVTVPGARAGIDLDHVQRLALAPAQPTAANGRPEGALA